MLAKLFNNISVQSLVRASGFSLLSILLVIGIHGIGEANFTFGGTTYPISVGWYRVGFGTLVFFVAWWLNSKINKLGFLKNDYQLLPVFTLMLLPAYFFISSLEELLVLPLGVLLLLRLLWLAKGAEDSYALFDVGTLIGLMIIIIPESVLFIFVAWVGVLSLGRIYFRAFLMPLVGIVAAWFLVFTVVYWLSNRQLTEIVSAILEGINIGVHPDILQPGWWKFIPAVVVGLPALLEMFQVYGKANVHKRQSFTFLLLFLILFLIAGAFISDHSRIWVWLPIPLSVFVVNYIHYLRKNWQKDLVYVLLLLSLALLLFA